MTSDCPWCGRPLSEGDRTPWDEPIRRAAFSPVYHYECYRREQWREWKGIIAEQNDVNVADVTLHP